MDGAQQSAGWFGGSPSGGTSTAGLHSKPGDHSAAMGAFLSLSALTASFTSCMDASGTWPQISLRTCGEIFIRLTHRVRHSQRSDNEAAVASPHSRHDAACRHHLQAGTTNDRLNASIAARRRDDDPTAHIVRSLQVRQLVRVFSRATYGSLRVDLARETCALTACRRPKSCQTLAHANLSHAE